MKELTRSEDYGALELTERIGESTICREGIVRKCMDRCIVTKISKKHAKIVLLMGRSLMVLLRADIKG